MVNRASEHLGKQCCTFKIALDGSSTSDSEDSSPPSQRFAGFFLFFGSFDAGGGQTGQIGTRCIRTSGSRILPLNWVPHCRQVAWKTFRKSCWYQRHPDAPWKMNRGIVKHSQCLPNFPSRRYSVCNYEGAIHIHQMQDDYRAIVMITLCCVSNRLIKWCESDGSWLDGYISLFLHFWKSIIFIQRFVVGRTSQKNWRNAYWGRTRL